MEVEPLPPSNISSQQQDYSSIRQTSLFNIGEIVVASDDETTEAGDTDSFVSQGNDLDVRLVSTRTDDTLVDHSPGTAFLSPPLGSSTSNENLFRNRLYLAALTGDQQQAESLIRDHRFPLSSALTERNDTALHIAAAAQQTHFVEMLVEKMERNQLLQQNTTGYRAICFAAISGTVRIAKVMVRKNSKLPHLPGYNNSVPLCLAVTYKRKHMTYYLLSVTNLDRLNTPQQLQLLHATILSDYYDIGLKVLQVKPELALLRNEDGQTALHALARKPHAIGSRSQLRPWEECCNFFCFKGIYTKALMQTQAHQMVESLWKTVLENLQQSEVLLDFITTPSRFLHDAAKVGNVEFLIVLISLYPDLIWNLDYGYRSIFHVAVENRQESVFRLIYEIGGLKDIIANFTGTDNLSILHLAAYEAAPNHLNRVSGPALQMQRELQWFKEVEKIVAPTFSIMTNTSSKVNPTGVRRAVDGLTLREIFTENHRGLQKDGEKWMKSTSNSCMLVATLIATVVFAAAFTVPGGFNGNTGAPIYKHKGLFSVFVVADAIALISSTISIMMFLSILTSRFAEEDFLSSLPWRLLIGLATLFISIACMVVAFSVTFFMFYDRVKVWVPWIVAAMAVAPVTCFSFLQYKLWVDTFRATVWSKYLFKSRQRRLLDLCRSRNKAHSNLIRQLSLP